MTCWTPECGEDASYYWRAPEHPVVLRLVCLKCMEILRSNGAKDEELWTLPTRSTPVATPDSPTS
jgi:hypothetical protein